MLVPCMLDYTFNKGRGFITKNVIGEISNQM